MVRPVVTNADYQNSTQETEVLSGQQKKTKNFPRVLWHKPHPHCVVRCNSSRTCFWVHVKITVKCTEKPWLRCLQKTKKRTANTYLFLTLWDCLLSSDISQCFLEVSFNGKSSKNKTENQSSTQVELRCRKCAL